MRRFLPWIAPEGFPFIFSVLVFFLVVHFFGGWRFSFFPFLLLLFVLQFFREPRRPLQDNLKESFVLSPADGRVVSITQTEDPYLNRPSIKISVFMNIFNVHVNRAPVSGQVMKKWYRPGSFFHASLDKSSLDNESCAIWLKTDPGEDIVCVQIAGFIARRILCYLEPLQHIRLGERYGFIRFGSRVDLYVPVNARLLVSLGDKVKASLTVLCDLSH